MSKHPLPAGKGSGLPERSHAPQSPSPKEGGKRMTVTGHLREIRTRLVRSALVYLLLAVLCFFVVGRISEALMALGRRFHFVYTAPAELVTAYVKLSLVCALVLASPFLLYQIWGFVAPALKRTEKRLVFLGLCGGLVFFLLGAVFAYFVAIPFMLDFFANFDPSGAVLPMISYETISASCWAVWCVSAWCLKCPCWPCCSRSSASSRRRRWCAFANTPCWSSPLWLPSLPRRMSSPRSSSSFP